MVDQYRIPILCPERRQKTKIAAQLSPGVRSREIGQIGSQSDVVFRIKYMKCMYVH